MDDSPITVESVSKLSQAEVEDEILRTRTDMDELSRAIIVSKEALNALKQKEIALREDIIKIAAEKQKLKTILDKAGPSMSRKRNYLEMLKTQFFKRKDGF